jgi:hypothetical protein
LRLGALLTAVAVVLQGLWMSHRFPTAYLDSDLLSYLVYYRDLMAGSPVPFGYTVPKVLPIFLFGPLADPRLAMWLTIAAAALGGALIFSIAAESFGVYVALIAGAAYVLDPLRSVLTVRSSVDLYVGVLLFAAIFALHRRATWSAALLILCAALGKPVAALCGLAILTVPGVSWKRRLGAALVPFVALPATLALELALEGRPLATLLAHPALPNHHQLFVRVAEGHPMAWREFLSFFVFDWFGTAVFARTWPLVLIGVVLYVGSFAARRTRSESGDALPRVGAVDDGLAELDRARLVLLVPLLLAVGYFGLSRVQPFVPFTRFFWPLAVVLYVLAAFGVASLAERAPVRHGVRVALVVALGLALGADLRDNQIWREQRMLVPLESRAPLAERAIETIALDEECSGPAIVPLVYLPLAAWRAPRKLRRGELCASEDWADGRGCEIPRCVLVMPEAPTTERARNAIAELVQDGFTVEVEDEYGALVRSERG